MYKERSVPNNLFFPSITYYTLFATTDCINLRCFPLEISVSTFCQKDPWWTKSTVQIPLHPFCNIKLDFIVTYFPLTFELFIYWSIYTLSKNNVCQMSCVPKKRLTVVHLFKPIIMSTFCLASSPYINLVYLKDWRDWKICLSVRFLKMYGQINIEIRPSLGLWSFDNWQLKMLRLVSNLS